MMNSKLQNYLEWLLVRTEKAGLKLDDSRDIPYGQQLNFLKGSEKITLNIYYSQKKGISAIPGGKKNTKIYEALNNIVSENKVVKKIDHNWKIWVGTDESGKGDFFGPLVVCGFAVEEKFRPALEKLGIKDSKRLKDDKITEIAQILYKNYRKYFEVIMLEPVKYNELYGKFRDQNKKLNEMLAWMHGRVILNLQQRINFEGAVIDKFAKDRILLDSLKDLKKISLIQQVKAEEDLAVACASIIARYNFSRSIKELSDKFKLELPKGASSKVIEAGRKFRNLHSNSKLVEVAKIHFKTYREL